ncbi:TIMM50 [Bugula neritina]|uniref:Mitochondrial import inner membrane translocase subunit TIM50 n=1 Tax=Bugula neritina TaxID=10212 RepID=A0A7J7KIM1_BUGNE|nr:TIMM50 [Bugula neritina]
MDLTCLNRDLSRVILLDTSKEHYKLNPRNGLALKKWTGDKDDRELYDLAAFLQTIVTNKVKDVRSVLLYYNDFDDPMQKFRENQAAVLKTQSELSKLQAEEKMKKAQGRTSPFIPQKR